jgi:hypothetical protein
MASLASFSADDEMYRTPEAVVAAQPVDDVDVLPIH